MTKMVKMTLAASALALAAVSGVMAQSASADPARPVASRAAATTTTPTASTPAATGTASATRRPLPPREPEADLSRAAYLDRATQMFDRMDVNHDGRLSPEDRAAAADARFSRLDTDRNGSISRAEWGTAGADMAQRRETRRGGAADAAQTPPPPGGPRAGMGMRMMQGADANNDGVITREEFLAAAGQRFDRLDTDRNGTLTGAEKMAARDDRGGRHV